jgi:hypothetical protein
MNLTSMLICHFVHPRIFQVIWDFHKQEISFNFVRDIQTKMILKLQSLDVIENCEENHFYSENINNLVLH